MTATTMLRAALLALGGMTLARGPISAQGTVSGQGTAASVNTPASGAQQFAVATLPSAGGMADTSLANAGVPNTLQADALTSISTGTLGTQGVSAQTTAEAANVNVLNGLITAEQVVALAASYANGQTAGSDATGSSLLGLIVNGLNLADATPDPNTRIDLPGTGYVLLNERLPTGDGVTSSGLTVNMIHVFLQDVLTGATIGEIIVGSAASQATR